MTRVVQNFINGQLVDAADGRTSDIINPTTGEVYAQAPLSGLEDVNRAYAASKEERAWQEKTGLGRPKWCPPRRRENGLRATATKPRTLAPILESKQTCAVSVNLCVRSVE